MSIKKDKNKKRLVLLDAHAILHRAYHAMPDFSNSKGEPTGALYGLSAMLIKILNDLKPDYVAACYDLPGKTYRHEAFDGYKAQRKKPDPELVSQMKRSREIFNAFYIPIYEKEGYEADDLLGTIVAQLSKKKDMEIIIASGDMDTMQLIDKKKVRVFTLKKGIQDTVIYDEQAVKDRFGFAPSQLIDFKGLRGDPSDNIPGVQGIGEKTATDLILNFGTIEKIYKTIKKDKKAFEKAGIKPRIIKLLEENEEEAEFSKMLATIHRDVPAKYEMPKREWLEELDSERVDKLFQELEFRTLAGRFKEVFLGGEAPIQGTFEVKEDSIPEQELNEARVALWILNSNLSNPTLGDIYNFSRTNNFEKSKGIIMTELKKKKLEHVFEKIEKPLIPVVKDMNDRGIRIDRRFLEELSKEYHKDLMKLEKNIYKLTEEEFNINSPKQLGQVLFEKMELSTKRVKKTATGNYSTKESELEKIKDENPVIGEILKYRELQKLLSTYIDNIPKMLDRNDRLHSNFDQAGTTTGRMSSNDPNLQNIPIRTDLGRKIRNAFIASDGFELVAMDYSQIELRIAAFLSWDNKLMEIFKEGRDVHNAVASEVFDVPMEEVTREMRRRAKIINFGILYGMGVLALKQNLGTDRAEAQRFYNEYFESFSGLATYLDEVKADTARTGFTETFFGRKRYFEGINSKLPFIRAAAERMAINAPIQGTEADIIKKAMVEIDEYLGEQKLKDDVRMLLQVHDELVFEIKRGLDEKHILKIKDIMENQISIKETKGVPILVEIKKGKNWGEME